MSRGLTIVIAIAGAAIVAVPALAQECFDFDTYLPIVHDENLPDANVLDVDVAGDLALLSCDDGGLRIYDVSAPAAPELLSVWNGLATVKVTDVVGDLCYVGGGAGGLTILDIGDPAAPAVLGHGATVDPIVDLVVQDGLAYVVAQDYGLVVWDVSDPTAPHGISGRPIAGECRTLTVAGQHVFIANGGFLAVFDVSDPGNPTLATSVEVMGTILRLAVDEGWICAVGWDTSEVIWGRLVMIDVHDPLQPLVQPPLVIDGVYSCVERIGDRVLVDAHGLAVVDVSDPAAPRLIGDRPLDRSPRAIGVHGGVALVGSYEQWTSVDLSQPNGPAELGSLQLGGPIRGLFTRQQRAYVAARDAGLAVVDIADPASPTLLGVLDTPGHAHDVVVAGDLAYVADYAAGFLVVDVSDPATPVALGAIDTPGPSLRVAVDASVAYLADSWGGLQIIDVSDPTSPAILCTYYTGNTVNDVVLVGDVAVIADGMDRLRSVDISDPAIPQSVDALDLPGNCLALAHRDSSVYALCAHDLVRVHVTPEGFIAHSGGFWLTGDPVDLAFQGEHLYVANADRGVGVWSFQSIFAADEIDLVVGPEGPSTVAVAGSSLVVGDGDGGVTIFPTACDSVLTAAPPRPPRRAGPRISVVAPNPFNPRTECRFSLDRAQRIAVEIFDLRGRRVRALVDGTMAAGGHVVRWNGRDDRGRCAPAGVYLLQLRGETGRDCRRICLLK